MRLKKLLLDFLEIKRDLSISFSNNYFSDSSKKVVLKVEVKCENLYIDKTLMPEGATIEIIYKDPEGNKTKLNLNKNKKKILSEISDQKSSDTCYSKCVNTK